LKFTCGIWQAGKKWWQLAQTNSHKLR